MRLGLLGCAAALTLMGTAAAQAEMVYMAEPNVVATVPGYTTYSVPGPLPFSRFIVTEPAPVVVTEPSPMVVTEPRTTYVAPPEATYVAPRYVAPRTTTVVDPPVAVAPRESGIVTTGYSSVRSCFTDLVGVERCY